MSGPRRGETGGARWGARAASSGGLTVAGAVSRPRCGWKHPLTRALRGISAALLLAAAGLLAMPERAQAQTAYVSNAGQTNAHINLTVSTTFRQAQQFTTGSQAGGYTLGSVGLTPVVDRTSTSGLTVAIYTNSGGNPGTRLHTLTNPSSLTSDTEALFTPSSTVTLAASTSYFIVLRKTGTFVTFRATDSNAEDAGGSAGWSIANTRRWWQAGTWSSGSDKVKISVYPPLGTASTDAPSACPADATWCGTMTVGTTDERTALVRVQTFGYDAGDSRGSLSPATFTYRGTDYTVTRVERAITEFLADNTVTSDRLNFFFTGGGDLPDGTVLKVDGRTAPFTVGTDSHNSALGVEQWNLSTLGNPPDWIDGQMVTVSLKMPGLSNDANLSGLALFDASDGSPIRIGFKPDKTEYFKRVARHRGVTVNGRLETEVTVTPTLSDSRATFVIRERDGSRSVDANATRPGHQVMMTADGFGRVHRFRVKVTAEDGRTRKSYTVSLFRELRALTVGIHQTPNSTVEQGNDVVFQIRVTDPDPGDDVNLAALGGSVKFKLAIVCEKRNYGGRINDHGIRNRMAECQDLTVLGTRGGDTWGFSRNLTISDSALRKRTNPATGVETGTMTLRVGTEPDTIQDDGGDHRQNFQENFTVRLHLLHERDGGPPSFLKFTTSRYHWFTMGSIRLDGHLGDECEYLAVDLYSGCAIPASEQQAAQPLTAEFLDEPASHDGSSPFTLRLSFSEDVEVAPEDLRDHALSASGGTITGVTRVDGAKDLFELTVEPEGDGAVTVTLVPPPGGCTVEGAVCTASGKALSSLLAATVAKGGAGSPGDADGFTASYSNAPAGHGGATFTYDMDFSEEMTGTLSYRVLKFGGIRATDATVRRAKRRPPGQSHGWKIHIIPDAGAGDVVISLPPTTDCAADGAVCDRDGKMLTSGYSFTVPRNAPVSMSVADVTANESDGSLDFVVSIDPTSVDDITFRAFTRAGTATAGEDFTAVDSTFTIEAGDSSTTVSVPIAVDAVDDGGETVDLFLDQGSTPDYVSFSRPVATGMIENDGPIPQAWMARFGRTVADQVLEAVDGRLHSARAPGFQATVAGQALSFGSSSGDAEAQAERQEEARTEALGAWLRGEDPGYPEQVRTLPGAGTEDRAALSGTRTLSVRDLFTGTSFSLTGGTAGGGTVSAWGRGTVSRFDGREGELTLDGEVGNLMLGADFVRGRATAGLMLSHARGSGGYRGESTGHIEASLTGLYPYGRYEASDRLSVWGVAGYGEGTLTVEPEDQAALETDMGLAMASVGVRGILMKAPPEGGAELAVTSDTMAVRTTSEAVSGDTGNLAAAEAGVTRLRLGLEGSRAFRFKGGASLTPRVELGVRHDGGDAETGFGADVGAGLAWSDPARGLSADMRARGLLTHEDGSFRERGFAGSLAWDPAPGSARGPSLSILQTVGAQASGGVEALLGAQTAQALEAANENAANELERRALEARLGYGFALAGGRYTGTPELGLTMTDSSRETVLGWRLAEEARAGLAFGLDVEVARQQSAHGEGTAGHRLGLGFGWRLQDAGAQAFELRVEGSRRIATNDGAEHRVGVTLTARW